jgi:hypothetical protein
MAALLGFCGAEKMKQSSMLNSDLRLLDEERRKEAVTFAHQVAKTHSGSATGQRQDVGMAQASLS